MRQLFLIGTGLILLLAFAGPLASAQAATSLMSARYLHTQGKDIVNRAGKAVHLRGVNVGGWLVTEGWMCGQNDDGGRGALEQLEKRFGPEKAAALMNAWYDHWFTAKDLDNIQSYGFNVIRVPFGYRNLQDADGKWKRDAKSNIDFSRMDWVVKEAAKRGIYVVFDLHVWPRQLEKDGYGLPSRWSADGIAVRARMAELWGVVAKHYKGNGHVAAFDVINEPEGSPYNAPHHAFYDAIRAQDPERMVIEEWVAYAGLPKENWTNVVWSDHYPGDKKPGTPEERITAYEQGAEISAHPEVQCPIFMGEIKAPQDTIAAASALAQALNQRGWSWAVWTYKAVNQGGWALFNYNNSARYNLATDSYETLLARWQTQLTQWQDPTKPANYTLNMALIDGYKQ